MSEIDKFYALAAVASRVRKRDLPAFTVKLDEAYHKAWDEPGANFARLYMDYIALDDVIPRPRAPMSSQSSLPPRVVAAQAAAYMRNVERQISKDKDDDDKC